MDGMRHTAGTVIAALLATTLLAASTPAGPAGWRYDVYWRGVPVGQGVYARSGDGEAYSARWSMETQGLVAGFLSLDVLGQSDGALGPDGQPLPRLYRSRLETRKRQGEVVVAYDGPQARLVRNSIHWTAPRGPGDIDAPPVPPDLREGMDPASAMLAIGQRVRTALGGGSPSFALPVYDGVRRYDFRVRVEGRDQISVWWKSYPVIRLSAEVVPLAGFEKPEKWKDRPIQVALDPDTMLPRRIQTADGIVLTAEDRCATVTGCN